MGLVLGRRGGWRREEWEKEAWSVVEWGEVCVCALEAKGRRGEGGDLTAKTWCLLVFLLKKELLKHVKRAKHNEKKRNTYRKTSKHQRRWETVKIKRKHGKTNAFGGLLRRGSVSCCHSERQQITSCKGHLDRSLDCGQGRASELRWSYAAECRQLGRRMQPLRVSVGREWDGGQSPRWAAWDDCSSARQKRDQAPGSRVGFR